ncbi:hypothetical protein [Nocardioides ferulae]|uniref:hypothetical protein n=1 Tax=Nocardioides ferulae TaxID=2340821 RepID=UPI000EB53C88|nr:hypothetical protein [Nocardioides ferulae]
MEHRGGPEIPRGRDHRVEDVLHEALAELTLQGHAYLAALAERVSPGLARGPVEALLRLRRTGPLRVADLAAQLRLDEETTRSYVTELDRRGLVDRLAGPDGHALLVGVSAAASEPLELAEVERRGRMLDSLMDWPLEDRQHLARLLSRFVDRDDLAAQVAALSASLPDRGPIW